MKKISTGLEELILVKKNQDLIKGSIGLLCHSASIDSKYQLGVLPLKKIFKKRLKKLFGPQHGFVTDVQDNMVETKNFHHPYLDLPIFSLYGETRSPNEEMLEGLDTILVDLQDVGTRVYTYISTLSLLMKECEKRKIEVIILDRPNPVGGTIIEGNILEEEFTSFVGLHPIPMRHGLTMGEVGKYFQKYFYPNCKLKVIPMKGWKRSMFFKDTGLPWVNPSPNLPTMEGSLTYVGTVLFEGTNISEGRGTTRSLEIFGHPKIEPWSLHEEIKKDLKKYKLGGFVLRPLIFKPTFQKFSQETCGGFQIHITDFQKFRPWLLGQYLVKKLRTHLGEDFKWNTSPYEYEDKKLAIDLINGSNKIREWVESKNGFNQLLDLEQEGRSKYLRQRDSILIYTKV
jgi:uncharacterized protein YbbC (DUF1343 family)